MNNTIVALDMSTLRDNLMLIEKLGRMQNHYKLGLNFTTQNGMDVVKTLAQYKRIFLDLKLYDI